MTTVGLRTKQDLPAHIEELSHRVIGCAIEVHRALGPGLLEAVYEDALMVEFRLAAIRAQRQVRFPVRYKGEILRDHVIDIVVEGLIVIELKACEKSDPVFLAQVLSYLRVADAPLGLLFNFNVEWLREGMQRVFNQHWSGLKSPGLQSPSIPSDLRGE